MDETGSATNDGIFTIAGHTPTFCNLVSSDPSSQSLAPKSPPGNSISPPPPQYPQIMASSSPPLNTVIPSPTPSPTQNIVPPSISCSTVTPSLPSKVPRIKKDALVMLRNNIMKGMLVVILLWKVQKSTA